MTKYHWGYRDEARESCVPHPADPVSPAPPKQLDVPAEQPVNVPHLDTWGYYDPSEGCF